MADPGDYWDALFEADALTTRLTILRALVRGVAAVPRRGGRRGVVRACGRATRTPAVPAWARGLRPGTGGRSPRAGQDRKTPGYPPGVPTWGGQRGLLTPWGRARGRRRPLACSRRWWQPGRPVSGGSWRSGTGPAAAGPRRRRLPTAPAPRPRRGRAGRLPSPRARHRLSPG